MSRSAKAPRRRGQANHMFKVGLGQEQAAARCAQHGFARRTRRSKFGSTTNGKAAILLPRE